MSKKHKKFCATLNYIEHFFILSSTINGCISCSAFASLTDIPIGITSSAIGSKIYVITEETKKYQLLIKKKKHNKIVLLPKSTSNSIEVLISKALINSVISQDKFILRNNVLKNITKWRNKSKI